MLVENRFLVRPGSSVKLVDHDTRERGGMKKREGRAAAQALRQPLNDLQTLLYATQEHALLVVLQGMDTSGKDGVIRHVIGAFNPQGCEVSSFKVPTPRELAQDFLWRIHKVTPRRGMVGIFNRSHYEDVLVVRVESLVPETVWRPRYEHINAFERLLADSGVIILKFMLHISKDEQRERLQRRLDDSHAHWKFHVNDLKARAKWHEYEAAYEEALSRCSTECAPWYIIPADRKWYRNLVISQIIKERLEMLDVQWPPPEPEAQGLTVV